MVACKEKRLGRQQVEVRRSQAIQGVIPCKSCQVYHGHTLTQCSAVVQLREALKPPLLIYFDAGRLPPGYR